MFLHMLSDRDKEEFLKVATLLSLSDNELHWDGKTLDELTGNVSLDSAAFREMDAEKNILNSFMLECGKDTSRTWVHVGIGRTKDFLFTEVEKDLLKRLTVLPLKKMNDPDERIKAAAAVLQDVFDHMEACVSPASPKAMLYELMLLALADGEISFVEDALLKQFSTFHKLDELTYDDLLDRAKSMNVEANKTLSLILE
ncbi:MAG: hypothetical protein ACN6OU_11895 [Stenotrophomonas acidaminiphila]